MSMQTSRRRDDDLRAAVRELLGLIVIADVREQRIRASGRYAELSHGADISDEMIAGGVIVRMYRRLAAARAVLRTIARDGWLPAEVRDVGR